MNYAKIYDDLIEHRKMLPKVAGVYYERHHIIPKCLGGTNDSENLVYLTADDHFVAHLLLARVHGGQLWHAANCMTRGHHTKKIRYRRTFMVARKGAAIARRDKTVRRYRVLLTGEEFSCTIYEMAEKFKVNSGSFGDLHTGKEKTFKGIEMADNPPASLYHFYDSNTDTHHSVNKYMICSLTGISLSKVHGLLQGKFKSVKGVYLADNTPDPQGTGKKHCFVDSETGEQYEATSRWMSDMSGLPVQGFRMIARGYMLYYYKYRMLGTKLPKRARTSDLVTLQHRTTGEIVKGSRADIRAILGVSHTHLDNAIRGLRKSVKGYLILSVEQCT